MKKAKAALVFTALLGLAACGGQTEIDRATERGARAGMVPLVDSAGRVVAFAPQSRVANLPPGTPITLNQGGTTIVATVGDVRQSEGAAAGTPVVVGTDEGRPVITRVGPGTGDLSPVGVPVVVGNDTGGRPIIVNMTQAEADAFRNRNRRAPRAAAATPAAAAR